jgi:hypothetical protein
METMEELKTYTYEQLTDEAKENVKQWWWEHGAEHEWWDCAYEDFKEDGKAFGFDVGKMHFSGFYSQGDGACWSGHIDVVAWLRSHTEDSIGREAWIQLINEDFTDKNLPIGYSDGRYYHSGTMSIGYWDSVLDGNGDDLTGSDALLIKDSIFQGMHYRDLMSLIMSDDACQYKTMQDLAEAIEVSARDYADELYKQLREEYEYITGEENLIEMCNINDWRFDEEGRMV